jgi:hypothetical protein
MDEPEDPNGLMFQSLIGFWGFCAEKIALKATYKDGFQSLIGFWGFCAEKIALKATYKDGFQSLIGFWDFCACPSQKL